MQCGESGRYDMSEQDALERLATLSLLARWVDGYELEVAENDPTNSEG
jgi:hypothetical protein